MPPFSKRLGHECFSHSKTRIHLPMIRHMNSVFLRISLYLAVDWSARLLGEVLLMREGSEATHENHERFKEHGIVTFESHIFS